MAKRVKIEPAAEVTAVALLKPEFDKLPAYQLPDVEKSLAVIANKRKEYATLTINGVDDKQGYEAVKAGMAQMKDDRIAYVKAATENVITPADNLLKQFKKNLEKIVDEFKAGEQELRDKKDFIDSEKERLKAEAELAKVRIMQIRVNDLNVLGAIFDGNVYTFPYTETLMISAADVKDMTDAQFDEFLETVKTAFADEQTRLHEVRVQAELEEDRRRQEALQVQQQQQAIDAERKALVEKRTNLRIKELRLLGAEKQDDDTYLFPDKPGFHLAPLHALLEMEDGPWEELMYDIEHFTPATEPLVKYPDTGNSHLDAAISVDGASTLFEAAIAEVAEHAKSKVDGYIEGADPHDGLVETTMRFFISDPYTDFDISPKLFMRVYPDIYVDEALNGIETVANQGMMQNLNWVIIKKA